MTDKILLDDAATYGYSIKTFLGKHTRFLLNLSSPGTKRIH